MMLKAVFFFPVFGACVFVCVFFFFFFFLGGGGQSVCFLYCGGCSQCGLHEQACWTQVYVTL